MSQTGRSVFDFFLLALVADGAEMTPYALLRRLGISPGASIPALRRLERQGFVKRGALGPRRRQAVVLTEEGQRRLVKLDEAVAKQYEATPLDPESIGRILALRQSKNGFLLGSVTIDILEKAANKAKDKAIEAAAKRSTLDKKGLNGTVEEVYQWVVATLEAARWQVQEAALKDLHAQLLAIHGHQKRRVKKTRKPA